MSIIEECYRGTEYKDGWKEQLEKATKTSMDLACSGAV